MDESVKPPQKGGAPRYAFLIGALIAAVIGYLSASAEETFDIKRVVESIIVMESIYTGFVICVASFSFAVRSASTGKGTVGPLLIHAGAVALAVPASIFVAEVAASLAEAVLAAGVLGGDAGLAMFGVIGRVGFIAAVFFVIAIPAVVVSSRESTPHTTQEGS